MDNFPDNKQNNDIDVKQVSPSTELSGSMQENVVREYDNTSLDTAVNEDKIKTPLNAAELTPNSRRGRLYAILGAAGTSVVVGTIIVVKAFTGSATAENEPPKSDPVAEAGVDSSAPTTPTETTAPIEKESTGIEVFGLPTVAEIEINAEQTNEKIAEDLVNAFSNWSMSGANKKTYEQQYEGENIFLTLPEYITEVTGQSDPVYSEALFGDNATNPSFQEDIDLRKLQHNQVLTAHYQTYGTQNEAPFVATQQFVSLQNVVERDDGTTTMYIDTVRVDNADKNIVDGTGTGIHTRANYVINKVDGVVKIVEPPSYVDQ